jgi:hypothetical protein
MTVSSKLAATTKEEPPRWQWKIWKIQEVNFAQASEHGNKADLLTPDAD